MIAIETFHMIRRLLLTPLILGLISPLSSLAVPENPDQFKKLEEAFILPCDEIGNDACIARGIGMNACTFSFGIKQGKSIKEALDIADKTFAAIMRSNDLDPWTIFNEEGSIKKEVKDEAIYRINMCSKAIKESMPSLLKQTNGEVASAERIEEETKTFPYYWLNSIEDMKRGKR